MKPVYAGAENIISSLGNTAKENLENMVRGKCGILIDESGFFCPQPLPLSRVDHARVNDAFSMEEGEKYTSLEKMMITSINAALKQSNIDIRDAETGIIITTTKGNIDLLDIRLRKGFDKKRVFLHELAGQVAAYFQNPNNPIIVSNACVSGVAGIIYAERLIRAGKFRHVVVVGGDLITEFVVSGFLSFQSLSLKPCRPFDQSRDGLSLGEGCGVLIISEEKNIFRDQPMVVLSGASSNDANHISGPSRTGEGLQIAIRNATSFSGLKPNDIDFISSHGTATEYNDEMEARAFSSAGMETIPINSFKGYIGHTLGASGVIEAALSLQSMRNNILIKTAGFENHGVSKNINVISENRQAKIDTCLKTASGFGGSNAAVVFQKM